MGKVVFTKLAWKADWFVPVIPDSARILPNKVGGDMYQSEPLDLL